MIIETKQQPNGMWAAWVTPERIYYGRTEREAKRRAREGES